MFLVAVSIIAVNCLCISKAADCALPSNSQVNAELINAVNSGGGEGGGPLSIRGGPYYTCQVQGTTMETYQQLSVIMEYTSSNIDRVGQFEMNCQLAPDQWSADGDSLVQLSSGPGVTYDGSIGLWTNCSECTDTAGNDQHCTVCNSACLTDGLMRCTGSTSSDCCLAFEEDGTCSTDTDCNTNNFVANEQNNFTCACGLSCSDGYTFNSTSCTCYLTNICLSDQNPCTNNGSCVLGSSPDQYTCNCTGTGYTGTNCSDLIPVVTATSSPVVSSSGGVDLVSSSAPMATPTGVPNTCVDNCMMCSSATCCSVCANNYTIVSGGCTCGYTGPLRPPSCNIAGCVECRNRSCCAMCDDGYAHDRQDPCQCVAISSSSTTTRRSGTTGSPGGNPERQASSGTDVSVIIPSIILGILLLIVLIVLIAYVIYYFVAGSSIAASKAKLGTPFLPGEAHDNPMYVDPESFD